MTQLILDESWEDWLAFQRYPHRVIPIAALKRIFLVSYVPTKLKRGSSGEGLSKMLDAAGSIILPGQSTWIPTKKGVMEYSGQTTRKFSPLEWLTQEEGLFSGRPWDWENFLPRLLTIGGLVIIGLLITEGLHALFGLGAKVMGLRQDRDNTETP